MTRFPRTLLFALLFAAGAPAHAATVVPLNDTGQTLCYDNAGATVDCTTTGADDGRYGRDAANTAAALTKTGAGHAGFDFSKIANNGSVLAAGAALGTAATDWACTKDNVTGLTWEVKTTSGLRNWNQSYSWYSTDATSNGGNAGGLGTNTCGGTLSAYSNQCNSANYVAAVNATALCGYSDWRMPSRMELRSLVNFSATIVSPAATIDANYFPNTKNFDYWTANNLSNLPTSAWTVGFSQGGFSIIAKTSNLYIRLVRGVQ